MKNYMNIHFVKHPLILMGHRNISEMGKMSIAGWGKVLRLFQNLV